MASVTSSTHERKSKTNIVTKHGRLLLKHNAFTCVRVASILCVVALRPRSCSRVLELAGSAVLLPSTLLLLAQTAFSNPSRRQ